MGWKDWQVGEVVTESDFQSLVQNQVVQVYADSTARTTALGTAVADGMVSYLTSSDSMEIYNGSAWISVSSPGDITAVTAGTALTGGGTAGDVTLDVNLAAISIPVAQISDLTATAAELNILDGVTATASELNVVDGITATTAELNYVGGVTSGIQTQLDGKQAIVSGVSDTEIGYLDGVTSAIQTQLDSKVSTTNGSVTTAATGSNVVRNITLSTSSPTGGSDGDVWLVYTA